MSHYLSFTAKNTAGKVLGNSNALSTKQMTMGVAEVGVSKCQIFFTDQFFPNEFTPIKSAQIVTSFQPKMHKMGKEDKF